MPDYTVSGDVDSMLRSANDAAIRSAIGVGQTDAPTFLSVTISGDGRKFYLENGDLATGRFGSTYWKTGELVPMLLRASGALGWSSANSQPLLSGDTFLYRDGAEGILAQRNGTAKQALRVYNTALSGAPEWAEFDWITSGVGNTLRIGTNLSGTGAARPIDFVTGGVVRMSIAAGGNVGIGTATPGAKLEVSVTAATGVRESILRASVSDNATSAFHIYNATFAEGKFVPGFSGSVFDSTAPSALFFVGQTDAANDTGTSPLIIFAARTTSSTTDPNNGLTGNVTTRPLFTWWNNNVAQMQMSANGNLGIGTTSPASKLQVSAGDIEIDTIAKGVILKSPDGTRYRVTAANGGTLSVTAV